MRAHTLHGAFDVLHGEPRRQLPHNAPCAHTATRGGAGATGAAVAGVVVVWGVAAASVMDALYACTAIRGGAGSTGAAMAAGVVMWESTGVAAAAAETRTVHTTHNAGVGGRGCSWQVPPLQHRCNPLHTASGSRPPSVRGGPPPPGKSAHNHMRLLGVVVRALAGTCWCSAPPPPATHTQWWLLLFPGNAASYWCGALDMAKLRNHRPACVWAGGEIRDDATCAQAALRMLWPLSHFSFPHAHLFRILHYLGIERALLLATYAHSTAMCPS